MLVTEAKDRGLACIQVNGEGLLKHCSGKNSVAIFRIAGTKQANG